MSEKGLVKYIDSKSADIFKLREKILQNQLAIIKLKAEKNAWKPRNKDFQIYSKHLHETKKATITADLYKQSQLSLFQARINLIKDDISAYKKNIHTIREQVFAHMNNEDLDLMQDQEYLFIRDIIPDVDGLELFYSDTQCEYARLYFQEKLVDQNYILNSILNKHRKKKKKKNEVKMKDVEAQAVTYSKHQLDNLERKILKKTTSQAPCAYTQTIHF